MKSAAAAKFSAPPADEPDRAATQSALIQALRRENEELRKEVSALEGYRTLAYRDALTGLWNRRYFDERFGEELSRSRRSGKHGFSLLLVDVNDLKRVNDELGHQEGDETINWVGTFLKGAFRGHDVCCRTGGDEFAVILPDAGAAECTAIVQRLRAKLAAANQNLDRPIGLSFGSASCPDHATTVGRLVELADEAMYRDKRRQKGRATGTHRAIMGVPTPDAGSVAATSSRRSVARRARA